MSIFQVTTNISHNGNQLKIGEIFEAELAEFEHLVKSGALKLIEKAESVMEAKDIIEADKAVAPEKMEVAVDEQNTWGPKKEEVKTPETSPEKASDEKTTETSDTTEKTQVEPDGTIKTPSEPDGTPATLGKEIGDDL